MNVLGLTRQQLRNRLLRDLTPQSQIEVQRILGWRRRHVHPLRPAFSRNAPRHLEQPRPQPSLSICTAHVQKFELEPIPALADSFVVYNHSSHNRFALEQSVKPSAAVEAFDQDRRVHLRLAGRPPTDLDVMRSHNQHAALEAIDVLDQLAAIDTPYSRNLFAGQVAAGYQR